MAVKYIAVLSLLFVASAFGLREDAHTRASTQTVDQCFAKIPPSPPTLNLEWVASIKKWYTLSASAPTALRIAKLLLTGNKTKDACLFDAPCITVVRTEGKDHRHHDFKSCTGVHASIKHEVEDNQVPWTMSDFTGEEVWKGKKRIVATDNKTFILIFNCWEDGVLGFALYATQTDIPEVQWDVLFKLIDANGFHPLEQLRSFYAPNCPGQ